MLLAGGRRGAGFRVRGFDDVCSVNVASHKIHFQPHKRRRNEINRDVRGPCPGPPTPTPGFLLVPNVAPPGVKGAAGPPSTRVPTLEAEQLY